VTSLIDWHHHTTSVVSTAAYRRGSTTNVVQLGVNVVDLSVSIEGRSVKQTVGCGSTLLVAGSTFIAVRKTTTGVLG
jgi:hypothetical protein